MRLINVLWVLCFLTACAKGFSANETADKDLRIQVISNKNDREQGREYKIRIFPAYQKDNIISTNMQYRMDSCFYRLINGVKIYPEEIIPVAGGIKDCYEYLVVFTGEKPDEKKTDLLVYQDKFINRKIYQMILE